MFEATWRGQTLVTAASLPESDRTEKSPRFPDAARALLRASGSLSGGSRGAAAVAHQEESPH